jgi:hypothetical protein
MFVNRTGSGDGQRHLACAVAQAVRQNICEVGGFDDVQQAGAMSSRAKDWQYRDGRLVRGATDQADAGIALCGGDVGRQRYVHRPQCRGAIEASILYEVDAADVADIGLQFGELLRHSFTRLARQPIERLALARHYMMQDALDRFDHVAGDELFAEADRTVRVVLAERYGGQHHEDTADQCTRSREISRDAAFPDRATIGKERRESPSEFELKHFDHIVRTSNETQATLIHHTCSSPPS